MSNQSSQPPPLESYTSPIRPRFDNITQHTYNINDTRNTHNRYNNPVNNHNRYHHTSQYQPKQYNYVKSVQQHTIQHSAATQQSNTARVHSPTSPRHPLAQQSNIQSQPQQHRIPTVVTNHNNDTATTNKNVKNNTDNHTSSNNTNNNSVPPSSTTSTVPPPAPPNSTTQRKRSLNTSTNTTRKSKGRSCINSILYDKLQSHYNELRKYMPFELCYRMSSEIQDTYKLHPHLQNEPHQFRVLLVNFNLSRNYGGLQKEHGLQLIIEWKSMDQLHTHRRVAQSNISQLLTFMKRVKEFELDLNTLIVSTANNKPVLLSEISGNKTTGTSGAFERMLYKCQRTKTFQPISDIFPRPRTHSTKDIPIILQRNEPMKIENYNDIIHELGIIDHVVIDDDTSSDDDINQPPTSNTIPAAVDTTNTTTNHNHTRLTSSVDAAITRSNSNHRVSDNDIIICWWYTDKPNALVKSNTQQLIQLCINKYQYKSIIKSERHITHNSSVSEWYIDDTQVEPVLNALSITVVQALKATQLHGDIKTQQTSLIKIIKELQSYKSINNDEPSNINRAIPLRIENHVNMIVVQKSYFQSCTTSLTNILITDDCYIIELNPVSKLHISHNNNQPFIPNMTTQQCNKISMNENSTVCQYVKSLLNEQDFYLETLVHYTDDANNIQSNDPLCSQIFNTTPIVPTSIFQRSIGCELTMHTVIQWPYNIQNNNTTSLTNNNELPFNLSIILYWLQFYIKVTKALKCICLVPARLWSIATSRQSIVDCIHSNIQSVDTTANNNESTPLTDSGNKRRKTTNNTGNKTNIIYPGFHCNNITVGKIAITSSILFSNSQINSDTTVIDANRQTAGRQVFIIVEFNVKP